MSRGAGMLLPLNPALVIAKTVGFIG